MTEETQEDVKNRKSLNFVQWDKRTMRSHRELVIKSQLGAVILDIFLEYMDKSNAVVCSYRTLEELTGYSRASIGRAVSVLKKEQWIQPIKLGNTNAYVVNSAAFWQTWANKKQYSVFHATVIAAASEQEQSVKDLETIKLKKIPVLHKNERPIISNDELPPPDQQHMELD